MRMSIVLLLFGALGIAGMGCTSFSGGSVERATLIPPPPLASADWPKRETERVEPIAATTTTAIYRFQLDGSRPVELMRPEDVLAATTPIAEVKFNGVLGEGALRVFDVPVARDRFAAPVDGTDGFVPNARFVSSWYLDHPQRDEYELRSQVFEETSNRLLSTIRPGLRNADRAVRDLTAEGVGIGLPPPPASPIAPRARGLVVYLNGELSSEYERPLLDTLESRGWAIIHVNTVTTGGRADEPIPVMTDSELTRAALTIGERIDQALAENAYAVEAALAYCAEHRTDLPQRPVILVGCAAGAMAVPAVAARLGDRVDAAILVGGGANMLDISQRSESDDGGIKLDWGEERPSADRYTELLLQYLACTKLDPFHTAPYLLDRPVLVVHAVFDAVVPASAGLLLYDRLGQPDRLRFSGGHTAMFYFMDANAPKIATWLDRAIQERVRMQQQQQAAGARTRPLDPTPEAPKPPSLSPTRR